MRDGCTWMGMIWDLFYFNTPAVCCGWDDFKTGLKKLATSIVNG
jgi:hypothetical protein